MNNKVLIKFSIVFIALFFILISPITAFALDEVPSNNDIQVEEPNNNETLIEKDDTDETLTDEDPNSTTDNLEEPEVEEPTTDNPTSIQNEVHKVAVIIKKVDDEGNYLPGASLQILNSDGEVVEEWISTEEDYETFLPEGEYTLHEAAAPEGYEVAEDQAFTIKVEELDLVANVDWSETPCEHYGGTPLYYVEMNGEKSEVYCINQDWETPDGESIYNGNVISSDNIRNYTQQTTYVDANQNKEKIDVSDQSLTSDELYDKILDVIYHRQQATEKFSDLSEAEIRYVTESALKNYTNAGLTRVQGVRNESAIPEGATDVAYYSGYYWYLYPHFRSFVYTPDAPLGKDIYKTVVGGGDAFGTLARHWNATGKQNGIPNHNAKNSEDVRNQLARYYELYQYLVSEENPHPADMHLYLYSTQSTSEEEPYQNLLGVTWFNPYDEDYTIDLECVNTKVEVPEEPEEPVVPEEPVTPEEPEEPTEPETPEEQPVISYRIENPEAVQTGDNILLYLSLLIIGSINMTGCLVYSKVNNK